MDIGQRLAGHRGILLGAAIAAGLSIPAALFPLAPGVLSFAILFGWMMFTGACASIVGAAAISVMLPNELRGLSLCAISAFGILMTHGIAPSLVSVVAAVMHRGEDIRVPLAIVGTAASVLGAIAFAFGAHVLPRGAHVSVLDEPSA